MSSLSLTLSWGPAYLYPDGIRKHKEGEGLEGGINREATPKQPCNWGSGGAGRGETKKKKKTGRGDAQVGVWTMRRSGSVCKSRVLRRLVYLR